MEGLSNKVELSLGQSVSTSLNPHTMPADISVVKYQKLASEYSKMRAQVSVLKKAVLEEQSKLVDLKDTLKMRDHTIRKSEQETESLTFRNQQLTRRVTVLQEELDSVQQRTRTKGKGHGFDVLSSQPQIDNQSIIGEELQQKIEENARLHHQIYETEEEHRNEMIDMQSRVDELECIASGHQTTVEEINAQNAAIIEALKEERSRLQVRLEIVETELKDNVQNAKVCEEESKNVQLNLKSKCSLNSDEKRSALELQLELSGNTTTTEINRSSTSPFNNDFQEKIRKLEQSREHWMLEYRLLNMKYEKLQKKTQDLVALGSSSCSDESPVSEIIEGTVLQQQPSMVTTSLLGRLVTGTPSEEENSSVKGGDGGIDELRSYLVARINELVVQRQLVESKATTFHAELCAIHKRLAFAEQVKAKVQEELMAADGNTNNIKEELQTTTNNYKAQLSTMSDHLATMNEKLTAQRDEIDDLKFTLNNLTGKKKSYKGK